MLPIVTLNAAANAVDMPMAKAMDVAIGFFHLVLSVFISLLRTFQPIRLNPPFLFWARWPASIRVCVMRNVVVRGIESRVAMSLSEYPPDGLFIFGQILKRG